MTVAEQYNTIISGNVIKALQKRNMAGYYAPTKEDAVKIIKNLLADGSSISWGGSMTMAELGLVDELKKGNYTLLDRSECKNSEETKQMYHKALSADNYILSANAITQDGILINIDGTGNRVAALIYGPEQVIVVVGINKIVADVESGYKRIKSITCPKNALRLKKELPCSVSGVCNNCLSEKCICNQIVVTRRSGIKERIKVVIVGENLGY